MKSPREKYMYDPIYKQLVDIIRNVLHKCDYTPSEVREAAMLACIMEEEMRAARGQRLEINPKVFKNIT